MEKLREETEISKAFEEPGTMELLNECGSFGNKYEYSDVAKGFYIGYRYRQNEIDKLDNDIESLEYELGNHK